MGIVISWAAVLIGVIACTLIGRSLAWQVSAGRRGRLSATVVYGLVVPVMGAVPLIIAVGARWLGSFAGIRLFSGNGGNDGNLVGVGLFGIGAAFGAAVVSAALMLLQALAGSGDSSIYGRS